MCGTQDQVPDQAVDADEADASPRQDASSTEAENVNPAEEIAPRSSETTGEENAPVPTLPSSMGSTNNMDDTLPFDPVGSYAPETEEVLYQEAPGYVPIDPHPSDAEASGSRTRPSLKLRTS